MLVCGHLDNPGKGLDLIAPHRGPVMELVLRSWTSSSFVNLVFDSAGMSCMR